MFSGDAKTMDDVARIIELRVERPVINRTGLAGRFDVQLEHLPPQARPADQTAVIADAPTVVTAVQEQLGLRLVSDRAPIEMLVIDHIERPTEN